MQPLEKTLLCIVSTLSWRTSVEKTFKNSAHCSRSGKKFVHIWYQAIQIRNLSFATILRED